MKRVASCAAVLVLAALLLEPSAAQAGMTAEKACSLEKLKAAGKALQCRLTALGTWVSKSDLRAWEKSVGQCRSKMADAFGNAERRYGADACASSVTAAELNAELDVGERSVSSAPLRVGRCTEGCYPYPRLPLPPRIDSVVPGDGSLAVWVSPAPEDVEGPEGGCIYSSGSKCRYPVTQFFVTAEPLQGGEKFTTTSPCRPLEQPCKIEGLVNGEHYVVRAAANSHVGTSDGTPDFTGPFAEGGIWQPVPPATPTPAPAATPTPPADYPELVSTGLCAPPGGISGGIREVHLTINNWLDKDFYIKEQGEHPQRRTKGRIPAGKTGHRCTDEGNTVLWKSTYHQLDIGFGQVPVERSPTTVNTTNAAQTIDLTNPWIGLPTFTMAVKDPTIGGSTWQAVFGWLALKESEGAGAALAWADKYFYLTRQNDDSCAHTSICWTLTMSRIPAGVPAGTTYKWTNPKSIPAPSPVPYR